MNPTFLPAPSVPETRLVGWDEARGGGVSNVVEYISPFLFLIAAIAVAILGSPTNVLLGEELSDEQKSAFFEKQVLPILEANCFKCHGGEPEVKAELRLTSRDGVLQGGELGPAIDLDDVEGSSLIEAINYGGLEMPPKGKLPDEQIALITKWAKLGLPWGSKAELGVAAAAEDSDGPPQVNEETKKFWSFVPPSRRPVPAPGPNATGNEIDRYIIKRLEQAGLTPSGKASKEVLLRRSYYDLIGLPPSPADVAAFLADNSPDAYERVVDRLLESPQYGERWGRHWLDLVRYAETNSYERDGAKPNVWRYRDYVIRSFNEDKPYDQFVVEQLAGDEIGEETPDRIVATGYYRLGLWQDEPVDRAQELYEDLDDIVTTTAQAFLGLTVNCARCHDHKIDPIPQADYYRFMAFFHGVERYDGRKSMRDIGSPEDRQRQQAEIEAHNKEVEQNKQQCEAIEALVKDDFEDVEHEEFKHEKHKIPLLKKRVPDVLSQEKFDEYVALKEKRKQLNRFKPTALDQALCVNEMGPNPRDSFILIRGSAHAKGDPVQPGFPSVLSPPEPNIVPPKEGARSSNRRIALAQWITDPRNPLTARVMVNRIWQFHFGRGLVRSPNNFGFQGIKPTHPDLLDWLAVEFMEGGWKMKRMHKLIMMSDAYQMSSAPRDDALAKDPQNDLFWRFNMRRLEAEEIRDSILAVNGLLNPKMFGPSIYPKIPQEVLAGQSRPGAGWGNSSDEERARRSIYIHTKRSLIVPFIAAFDGADPDATCPERFVTTQPTQALGTLNGEFLNDQARQFAAYLKEQVAETPADQVQLALTRVLQRKPSEDEISKGAAFIDRLKTEHNVSDEKALDLFCLMALNLNEFIYLD